MAKTFTKKTAAIALAAGLAFSSSAGAAFAPVAGAQQISEINAEKGSITIHKKVGAETHGNPNADGSPSDDVAGQPLDGAVFTVTKLKYDLTKEDEFAAAAALQKTATGLADIPADKMGEVVGTVTTGEDGNEKGEAKLSDLDAGVYYVTEQAPKNTDEVTYIPSAPFIVYVPMADSANKTWNRDVHVYPKNTELKATKEVKDADKNPAAEKEEDRTLTYTVTSPAPVLPPKRELTELNAVDVYKKGDFVNGLKIAKVEIQNSKGETIKELTEGQAGENQDLTDKYVVTDGAEEIKDQDGKVLADTKRTVTVTDKKLLDSLKPGDKLVVTLTGEVQKVKQNNEGEGIDDGEVTNFARTTGKTKVTGQPGFKSKEEPFETPNTSVESYFAAVRVIKFEKGEKGEEKKLDGAKFHVYSVPSTSECTATDNRTTIQKEFEVTGGEAVINALHVTDFVDGKAVTPEVTTNKFCIEETVAPSGFQLDTTPHELTVLKEGAQNPTTENNLTFSSTTKVENKKRPAFELPQTGGMGVLVMILGGLALLGGGAYAARRKA